MNIKNQCPKCLNIFSSKRRLLSHLEFQTECHIKVKKFICQFCQKKFTTKSYLNKHREKHKEDQIEIKPVFPIKLKLKTDKNLLEERMIEQNQKMVELIGKQMAELIGKQMSELIEKQNDEQNHRMAEFIEKKNKLIEKPTNITNNISNNLQIICIGSKDNYLDMLTQQWGFEHALEYIKDCALSNLTGDCKLIEQIYINNQFPSIHYLDKGKTKIRYFDENKNKIIDSKAQLGRKLANNLQNSYLKGVNHVIAENLNHRRCPNKFLEDYDLQTWNQHKSQTQINVICLQYLFC